jgi:hypothetical protein
MELVLNLAWILQAALMFCLWLRFAPRTGPNQRNLDRRRQFVALTLLLLILFPVISVTDDLQAIQNAVETDSSLRRDHIAVNPHSIFHMVAALPLPAFAELSLGAPRLAATRSLPVPMSDHPALTPIQNRPPPTA